MKIPSKDAVIQGLVAAGKLFGAISSLAAYSDVIPPKYLPVGMFVFALASTFREGTTTILSFVRGDKITLTPPGTPKA